MRRRNWAQCEYDLLKILVSNAGRFLTQRHLIRELFGDLSREEGLRPLRSTINSLRQKLEANPARPSHIGMEPGVGYRLWTGSRRNAKLAISHFFVITR